MRKKSQIRVATYVQLLVYYIDVIEKKQKKDTENVSSLIDYETKSFLYVWKVFKKE